MYFSKSNLDTRDINIELQINIGAAEYKMCQHKT